MVYKARPLDQRFWEKVERAGDTQCWPWTGSRTKSGYGLLGTTRATHISLELHGKPKPAGGKALHACDNPICVNPGHLRWGTDADNAADMVGRKRHHANRRTHCKHGHPLSGENLIERKNGQRGCRECNRAHARAYNAKPEVRERDNRKRRERREQRRSER